MYANITTADLLFRTVNHAQGPDSFIVRSMRREIARRTNNA